MSDQERSAENTKMPLNPKSTISGALIAYLFITAIQTFIIFNHKSLNFYFSAALNHTLAICMVIGAWMILKEKRIGFIIASSVTFIGLGWSFVILIQHPLISDIHFWSNILIYSIVLFLAIPHSLKKNEA